MACRGAAVLQVGSCWSINFWSITLSSNTCHSLPLATILKKEIVMKKLRLRKELILQQLPTIDLGSLKQVKVKLSIVTFKTKWTL